MALGDIMATKSGSVDPSKFTEEIFDLYSIPAFDRGEPVIVAGSEIGSAKQVVQPGDVLLSKIVPHIRRSWIVGKERGRRIIASGEWIVFRSERASPDYLRQVLVGDPFHTQFMNTVAGVGGSLLRARLAHVAAISIPLPPLAEQRRIAEVLDRAEALRSKRRAALAQLDSLTQSLFLDLFGDPTQNPKGWPVAELGKLCEKVIDCPHATPAYATSRTEYPCVRSSNIQNGDLTFSDTKYVEESEYVKRIARGKPQLGDVIYCREGARFGNAARIAQHMSLCLGQRMMLFRPDSKTAVGEYLWAFLASPAAYRQATSLAGGSAAPHVNIRDIIAFRLPLPPLKLQREFARRVTAVETLKTAHRASLAELDALFATLQHRAFRGEL